MSQRKRFLQGSGLAALIAIAAIAGMGRVWGKQRPGARTVIVGLSRGPDVWIAGAFDAGRGWRTDEQARLLVRQNTPFTRYDLRGQAKRLVVGTPELGEAVGGWFATQVNASTNRAPQEVPLLALSGAANPIRRIPRPQSLRNPVYERSAAALLRGKGLTIKRVRLTQHLRIDLNGDGTEEVLLSAHSRDAVGREPRVQRGDYALVALRFAAGGRVRTVPLVREVNTRAIPFSAPNGYRILGCADINGDGRLEIALYSHYYEGDGIEIFTFDGKAVRSVITAGWGV